MHQGRGPLVLLAIALVLLAVGAVQIGRQVAFGRRAVRTEGTVIAWMIQTRTKGPSTYLPVVQFWAEKRLIQFKGLMESRDWPERKGEKLGVLYDPADPDNAHLDDPVARYTAAGVWIFLGVSVGAAAVLLWRRSRA